jgi:hypothetical protein
VKGKLKVFAFDSSHGHELFINIAGKEWPNYLSFLVTLSVQFF